MEVHWIVSYLSALTQLIELDALYLIGLESLANDSVTTEVAAQSFIGAGQTRKAHAGGFAAGNNPYASRQQSHRGPGFDAIGYQLGVDSQCSWNLAYRVG